MRIGIKLPWSEYESEIFMGKFYRMVESEGYKKIKLDNKTYSIPKTYSSSKISRMIPDHLDHLAYLANKIRERINSDSFFMSYFRINGLRNTRINGGHNTVDVDDLIMVLAQRCSK